ncbi:hypothetical protein M3P36_02335 [Altererythrobacter sp. KTW20L]|uniref:hypothetical protein n=1 Tax=Altererythrobacter sp. KTW20L TaxID=2942210 RepID=UPI0020BFAF9B|nr:hypothetical protein [Altererythrobacter sp. KTW20L]MCL6249887.1 hypothetical protein [Altererythrobacter sp. KTW20L]
MRKHTKRLALGMLACASMFAVTTPQATAQDGTRVFTRTGQWQLDAAEEECRIARAFTNGTDQVALALERNRADPVVRLVLVSNAMTTFRTAEELGYRLLPSGEQRSARYIHAEMDDGQRYFNLGNVRLGNPSPPTAEGSAALYDRAAELDHAEAITAIEINSGLTSPVRLETGSLRDAMQAMQVCTDDLLLSWGLDWEKHQTMTRRVAPAGPAFEWVPTGVVGFQDFAAFAGARNPFRVMVGADGKPTACHAHWVSLDARKNDQICNGIMQNGNFLPALDAAGEPMASYWMVDYMAGLSRPFGR